MKVTVHAHRIQDGDELEFDGPIIAAVPSPGRTNTVNFVVAEPFDEAEPVGAGAASDDGDDEATGSALPAGVDDLDLSNSTARVTTLADVLDMDEDAPLTDLKGIGDARAADIPVDTVGGLPADMDALNAFVGDAAFESLNRYYNDELFDYLMEEYNNE